MEKKKLVEEEEEERKKKINNNKELNFKNKKFFRKKILKIKIN